MNLSSTPASGPTLRRAIPPATIAGRYVLTVSVTLRTSEAAKHMTADLQYLLRYAQLSEKNPNAHGRYLVALDWARNRIAAHQAGFPTSWFDGYADAPSVTLKYDAEHRCVVSFIDLLPECDKIYWALRSPAAQATYEKQLLRAQKANVYRILRNFVVQIGGGDRDHRLG